ncbi:MAG TPA: nucleotidyltransferase family protein [Thermomicrobiales bacterium]|nr:nucleotidyltransferase family protein [Thermomicrobiales bacterium]
MEPLTASQALEEGLAPEVRAFYHRVLATLRDSGVPFLVGGAYAYGRYTGLVRHTKDLDVMVRPGDCADALAALAAAGYRTELTFHHWLGKAFDGDALVDVIFSSGNGACPVDDEWFANAVEAEIFDVPVRLCPPEEMIWQKAYIMERERCDLSDVAHLLRSHGGGLDWARLLRRFGPHWRVLLSALILFGFIYPAERDLVPGWVMADLLDRARRESDTPAPADRVCRGTLLSLRQYLPDVERFGDRDARLAEGHMTPRDLAAWTAAFEE